MHYYYTRWKFNYCPDSLDSPGPYHTTLITDRNLREILDDTVAEGTDEFFVKEFPSEAEMRAYWDKQQ